MAKEREGIRGQEDGSGWYPRRSDYLGIVTRQL
jgi:hypothetical protein